MKYNTKDIYFGWPTYKVEQGDFWYTAAEAFIKQENSYIKLNSKNGYKYNVYTPDTDEFVTVAGMCPITSLMSTKKEIPQFISEALIRLYLMKYKMITSKQRKIIECDFEKNNNYNNRL